jgi:undecaprenyl-diphosphatase
MPTMVGAFVYELLEVRDQLSPERAVEIAIGFLTAFVAALVVIKPFLRFVTQSGFAPFGWYRIALGALIFAALGAGWL